MSGEDHLTSGNTGPRKLYAEHVQFMDALVVNGRSLSRLHDIVSDLMRQSGNGPRVKCSLRRSAGGSQESGLEQLLADPNPRAEAIEGIQFESRDGETEAKVAIRYSLNTLEADAASHSLDALKDFKSAVSKEMRNISALHSPIRILIVGFCNSIWPAVLGSGVVALALLIMIVGLFEVIGQATREGRRAPTTVSSEVPKKPGSSPTDDSGTTHGIPSGVLSFLSVLCIGGIVLICISLLKRAGLALFPTLVFDLGEGHDRYLVVKQWRFYLLTGILISGVLIRLVLDWTLAVH